jgi:hypothetical protein
MFAVVNHLHLSRPVDEIGEAIRREGVVVLSALPGFEDFYFVKVSDDHGIVIILWDSPANAQNGAAKFGPTWFAQNIAPYLAKEQERSAGAVIARYEG